MLITAASVAGWLHSKLTIVFSSSLPSPWIGDAVHRQFINPRGCSRRNADRQGRRRLRLSPNTETVGWKTELACLACAQRSQRAHMQLDVQSSFAMVPGYLWCLVVSQAKAPRRDGRVFGSLPAAPLLAAAAQLVANTRRAYDGTKLWQRRHFLLSKHGASVCGDCKAHVPVCSDGERREQRQVRLFPFAGYC